MHLTDPSGDEPTSSDDVPFWQPWPDDLDAELIVTSFEELCRTRWTPPIFGALPRQVAA
jgi:hypothetical protein